MNESIRSLAFRVRDDPFFLASVLNEYARLEHLDELGLAALLDCGPEMIGPLALCRRPRRNPPLFRQDIDQIAARFDVSADALAEIVRAADAIAVMGAVEATERGFLLAARDHEDPSESEEESS